MTSVAHISQLRGCRFKMLVMLAANVCKTSDPPSEADAYVGYQATTLVRASIRYVKCRAAKAGLVTSFHPRSLISGSKVHAHVRNPRQRVELQQKPQLDHEHDLESSSQPAQPQVAVLV